MSATNEAEVRDVPLDEALSEAASDIDQADDAPRPRPGSQAPPSPQEVQEAKKQNKEDLEALAPQTGAKEWRIGAGQMERIYVQRELSVVGKAQWFSLVGEILDKALSGENSLSLNSLLSPPERKAGQLGLQDFQDADTFVHAVGKLLVYTPEFLEKSICIWLSVPDYEADLVKDLMRQSPQEGGMSDEDFEGIFGVFIDQNYKAINDFFRQRFPRLRARYQARAKEAASSDSRKR